MYQKHRRENHSPHGVARLIILLVILPFLAVPAACETVGAGIFTAPAHACPGDCTCMPEAQAERLGYTTCSPDQDPCFHGSMGEPLYCYHPPESSYGPQCTAPAVPSSPESEKSMEPAPSFGADGTPVLPVSLTVAPNVSPALSNRNGSGGGPVEPGFFGTVIGFLRSLLGMK